MDGAEGCPWFLSSNLKSKKGFTTLFNELGIRFLASYELNCIHIIFGGYALARASFYKATRKTIRVLKCQLYFTELLQVDSLVHCSCGPFQVQK